MGLSFKCGWNIRSHTGKKYQTKLYLSLRSYQVSIVLQLGWLLQHPPTPCLNVNHLDLVQTCPSVRVAPTTPTLHIRMLTSSWVCEFSGPFQQILLYLVLPDLCLYYWCYPINNGWLTWGGEDVCVSFMAQSSTDTYSLLFNQLWVVLIMATTVQRHFSDEVYGLMGTKMSLYRAIWYYVHLAK